jgi:hypothetical protein
MYVSDYFLTQKFTHPNRRKRKNGVDIKNGITTPMPQQPKSQQKLTQKKSK